MFPIANKSISRMQCHTATCTAHTHTHAKKIQTKSAKLLARRAAEQKNTDHADTDTVTNSTFCTRMHGRVCEKRNISIRIFVPAIFFSDFYLFDSLSLAGSFLLSLRLVSFFFLFLLPFIIIVFIFFFIILFYLWVANLCKSWDIPQQCADFCLFINKNNIALS